MAQKRKTRSTGVGDTVAKITEATGIDKLVKWIAGEDCGCDERKEALNKMFPYNKPECLTEEEYDYLVPTLERFKSVPRITPSAEIKVIRIYNRVFHATKDQSQCDSCWRTIVKELNEVVSTYEQS